MSPRTFFATFVALALAAPAAHAQKITVVDLNPTNLPGFTASFGGGASGSTQTGYGIASDNNTHALLWQGSAPSALDLNPAGFTSSFAQSVSGGMEVGAGVPNSLTASHALLWSGTPDSAVDLNPDGFSASVAHALSGSRQIGSGTLIGGTIDHALLWSGTAASVADLNPAGFNSSEGTGISGTVQVGYGRTTSSMPPHALLWTGTAASVIDLNPTGYRLTAAYAVSGTTQVGYGYNGGGSHALLWKGTPDSVVDLNPAGFTYSVAYNVSGSSQVGRGYGDATGGTDIHALFWRGTAASAVDLNAYLPAGFNMSSDAFGVDDRGSVVDIVGSGTGSSGTHAFLWRVSFASAAPVLVGLSPSSAVEGKGAFTLTAKGTGFKSNSVIKWNGATQKTTFVSASALTASIPASLIAAAGTASVTVTTPKVGTSAPKTFAIIAKPVLQSLSPPFAKAGGSDFNLNAFGTGFFSNSIVKWNGQSLTTRYFSSTELQATVPAFLIATSGTVQVTVTTPKVATSASRTFTVTP